MKEDKKFSKGELGAMILGMIGIVGFLSLALAAPNAVQLIELFKKRGRKYHSPKYMRKVVDNLIQRGYIVVKKQNGEDVLALTEKGKYEVKRVTLRERSKEKPKKWDQKWRMVIFDIEEKKRHIRDIVRENIETYGFVKLQQSVWVYPYECEELITFFKADCKLGKELLYITASEIENEEYLKKKFKLL